MDPAPSGPALPADPPEEIPCGGIPPGFPEDATAEQCAMLDELAGIAMTVARTLGRQIAATGRAEPADVASLAEMMRAARRTIALRNKLVADCRMTDEERAAARARRDAARAAALLRTRKEAVRATLEDLIRADAAERETPPADTERLVQDVRERLLDADIERAFGVEEYSAIILGICKDLAITPRKETWSHRLMQVEIAATAAAVRSFQDGLKDPGAPAPPGQRPPDSG